MWLYSSNVAEKVISQMLIKREVNPIIIIWYFIKEMLTTSKLLVLFYTSNRKKSFSFKILTTLKVKKARKFIM